MTHLLENGLKWEKVFFFNLNFNLIKFLFFIVESGSLIFRRIFLHAPVLPSRC